MQATVELDPQTAHRRPTASDAPPRLLAALVFTVGFTALGAEIAAVRLLAPYFGASTIVWANTIAVVLVALAIGYWLGGRAADRHPHLDGLCVTLLAASGLLAVVPFAARPLLDLATRALDNISASGFLGSLVAVSGLVAVPIVLLGAASPWALRLALTGVERSGEMAGRLYAISTAGSLVGTLGSALVLIPAAGTRRTFLLLALMLALVAVWGLRRRPVYGLLPLALGGLLLLPAGAVKSLANGRVIYETETPYQYARVIERTGGTRTLELNEGHAVHSLYRPGTVLTGDYWDGFLVLPAASLRRAPAKVAILGNAAGTTARAYNRLFPRTVVDAVEIDGKLTEIGQRYFGLQLGPRLRAHTADARPYLRATSKRFDAIFLDAYRQPYIPFYLVTREFFELVRSHLAARGALVVNVGHPQGDSRLERVVSATLAAVFPHVARDPIEPTNTLVVASEAPVTPQGLRSAPLPTAVRGLARYSASRLKEPLDGGVIYTDDRAPVEWLVDRSLIGYAER